MDGQRPQAGFTLIELLVALAMVLILAGAAMTASIVGIDQQKETSYRANALDTASVGLARMVRETRQSLSGTITDSGFGLNIRTFINSGGVLDYRNVRYDCTSRTKCVRYQASTPTGPADTRTAVLATSLANTASEPVFTGECNGVPVSGSCPTIEGVNFTYEIRPSGGAGDVQPAPGAPRPIKLQDATALINVPGGQP